MTILARDRVAIFLWVFAAIYATGIGLMFYLLARDGPPPGYSTLTTSAIAAFFGCGVLVLVNVAGKKYTTTVLRLDAQHIRITVRYPFRKLSADFPLSELPPACLVETKDSENEPYFFAQLPVGFPFAEPVIIAQGSKPECEAMVEKFNTLRHQNP
jgi:hypothetical protein